MKVLVLGANGFIGSAIVAALARAGVNVRGVVRDRDEFLERFPGQEAERVDLRDRTVHEPGYWVSALNGIDAIVNAAGVLQPRRERDAWAVHCDAPNALYEACENLGVKRVVHISAVGIDDTETVFARSKRAADAKLMERSLEWTILRPTIVIGEGSYGGTSFLRAIAAFPLVTLVVGDGRNQLDFIHRHDLAESIVNILQSDAATKTILEPASHERLTFLDSIRAYRGWLGLRPRRIFAMPPAFAKAVAYIGDIAKLDPITSTALAQFEGRLTGDARTFEAVTGTTARGLSTVLAGRPAETQDLWHARLYLIRPIIRLALAVLWLVSGLLGLFAEPNDYLAILEPLTTNQDLASAVVVLVSILDLAIAAALFFGWQLKGVAIVQLATVFGYTIALTLLQPDLWGDPFGALLKNVPIIVLIVVHWVLEHER